MARERTGPDGHEHLHGILLLKLTNTRGSEPAWVYLSVRGRREARGNGKPRRRGCGTETATALSSARSWKTWTARTTVDAPPTMFCNRRERSALAAELALRGRGVRIRLEMAAGVHHHAELGEQQRQRQHMHEPTAITSNQKGLREEVFPRAQLSTSSDSRKLHARWSP